MGLCLPRVAAKDQFIDYSLSDLPEEEIAEMMAEHAQELINHQNQKKWPRHRHFVGGMI